MPCGNEIDLVRRYTIDFLQKFRAAITHHHQSIREGRDILQHLPLLRVRFAENSVQSCHNGHAQFTQ